MDPVVASKVHFTKHVEELENYIPKSRILKELGGEEDWSYQYVEPSPDENSRMSDEETKQKLLGARAELVTAYQQATLKWLSSASTSSSDPATTAQAQSERSSLAEELRTNYWKVDPYVRARTLYDRTGVIKEGGVINL